MVNICTKMVGLLNDIQPRLQHMRSSLSYGKFFVPFVTAAVGIINVF